MGINLQKGQKISLAKESGTTLSKIIMGLGWDAKKTGGLLKGMFGGSASESIDLDASCILFDDANKVVDTVWFRQLKSRDGSVTHTGDNRTGEGEGDDEQIIVLLDKIPANVKSLVFTVNSFTGQTFDAVENAYCRIVDGNTRNEIARYTLSAQGSHSAQIMAKVYRHNDDWKMHAIGENANGRTFDNLLPQIVVHL
ncbi:TerD family protein [Methylocucumis oryzae]|uniref:Tellurium resistance protein terZ n=1 Tax=Methylocucumis oryzae TaxID=1632867 RepID=A0A0F3IJL7_9GAMM|nr:TerD family protein [Methylocucumis oryzae]KJV05744.1 Tellurium resistance protein terZ [Methylocucumis oryzae]